MKFVAIVEVDLICRIRRDRLEIDVIVFETTVADAGYFADHVHLVVRLPDAADSKDVRDSKTAFTLNETQLAT